MTRRGLSIRIKPHAIVMTVLFVGALVVGYLLLPGENERIAMLERDGKYREALRIMQARFDAGDRRQRTLFELQRLQEHFGDLAKVRQTLELFAAERPRDASAQRQLAQFYRQTQDEAAYVRLLQSQIDSRYSDAACRELIGILRRAGKYAEEQAAIQSCRAKGYRRAEDIVRLASLLAAGGDFQQASALLRSADDLRRLKTDRDRLQLFAILLEADQPRDAYRRAVRWLKGTREEGLALTLVEMLARDNKHNVAIDLAREVSVPGDSLSLAVAEMMADRGQTVAAQSYLRGWLERARLTDAVMAGRFIHAALDADAPEIALLGAEAFGLRNVVQADLAALAEALAAIGNTAEFERIRALLTPESLAQSPLLVAAIELSKGAPETTAQLLDQVQVDDLVEWRLALWNRLMQQTGRAAVATAALRQMGAEPVTPNATVSRLVKRNVLKKSRRLRNRGPGVAAKSAPGQQQTSPKVVTK